MATKLKLDYDNIDEDDVALIFYHRGWLLRKLGLEIIETANSTHGIHVEATVSKNLRPENVILAQILMGSDIYREIYNFLRNCDGELISQWNRLFDKKSIILGTRIKEIGREIPNPKLAERLRKQIEKKVVK